MKHPTPSVQLSFEQSGEISTFVPALDEHCDEIIRYLVRRVEPDEVLDALTDVAAVARDSFSRTPAGDERLELYSIAHSVVGARCVHPSAHRAERRRGVRVAGERDGLLDAVAGLDERELELLRLRAWERLTVAEAAMVTRLSERAVGAILDDVVRRLDLSAPEHSVGEADDSMWMSEEGA